MIHILETERLYLREYQENDFSIFHEIFSDSDTMRYYPSPFTKEQTRTWMRRNYERYQPDGYGLWAVCLKESDKLIGDCGLSTQTIKGLTEVEIGYHINKEYWSKGYASEAAVSCKEYAFNSLKLNNINNLSQ